MPLISVLSIELEPDRVLDYRQAVAGLAERAREQGEAFKWTAHELAYGGVNTILFASSAENFTGLSQNGLPADMVARVLGEEPAAKAMSMLGSCTRQSRTSISTDRPDLSYPPEESAGPSKLASVSVIRARPGRVEACEELIRKVAEAIPKVGDPARMTTFQTLVGDLSQYWTVRGLEDLSELDDQLPPSALLDQAFGPSEGGLIYRAGLDAVEQVERSILIYREELSNPS